MKSTLERINVKKLLEFCNKLFGPKVAKEMEALNKKKMERKSNG